MPTFDELVEQRRQLLQQQAQQPAGQPQVTAPTSAGGKLLFGLGSLLQKKDISQGLANVQQQEMAQRQASNKAALGNVDERIKTEGMAAEQQRLRNLRSLESDETKRIRNAHKKALGAVFQNMDTSFMDSLSGEELGQLSPLDIAKLAAQQRAAAAKGGSEDIQKKRLERLENEDVEKFRERAANKFDKDKVVSKGREMIAASNTALQMLDQKNPVADEAVKTFLARASGEVGALTDRDVARFGGSKALLSKINQTATQLTKGKLTDENRQFLRELALSMSDNANRNVEQRARELAKQQGKIRSEVSENELLGIYGYQPIQAASTGSGLTPEQRRARIQELRKQAAE